MGTLGLPLSLSQESWAAELRCLGSALRATREQLLAFHNRCFLSELERCMSHPSRVGGCFLRHVSVPPHSCHECLFARSLLPYCMLGPVSCVRSMSLPFPDIQLP